MKHILTADQFTKNDLIDLVFRANHHREQSLDTILREHEPIHNTVGKILVNLFYEPSSRTFASFYSAMLRLGGHVIPVQEAGTYSSAVKGESLEDTIRTMECYVDVIVLRHKENGAAERAAAVSGVPIINAGDGSNEHPTQALLDFFTIIKERRASLVRGTEQGINDCLNGLTISIMGDLKHGRTVKSLVKLLRKFDVKINWVAPSELRIPAEYVEATDHETEDLNEVIRKTDVLYVTRAQLERMSVQPTVAYGVTLDHMALAKRNMVLMHPLPRQQELPTSLDTDRRSAYFRQMKYGLFMRMAVLESVL